MHYEAPQASHQLSWNWLRAIKRLHMQCQDGGLPSFVERHAWVHSSYRWQKCIRLWKKLWFCFSASELCLRVSPRFLLNNWRVSIPLPLERLSKPRQKKPWD
eukprot:Rmarinus@m.21370